LVEGPGLQTPRESHHNTPQKAERYGATSQTENGKKHHPNAQPQQKEVRGGVKTAAEIKKKVQNGTVGVLSMKSGGGGLGGKST